MVDKTRKSRPVRRPGLGETSVMGPTSDYQRTFIEKVLITPAEKPDTPVPRSEAPDKKP